MTAVVFGCHWLCQCIAEQSTDDEADFISAFACSLDHSLQPIDPQAARKARAREHWQSQWHPTTHLAGRACYNRGMSLLIDGYNLLHVTDIFGAAGPGTDLHRTRLALLNFLASAIDMRERRQTTIVFDAAGAPPGLPRMISHQGMTIHFAQRHSDADEMIEELLETHRSPKSLVVVSSDHRVQRAARGVGATFVDSAEWYAERRAALQAAGNSDTSAAKPETQLTPDELRYWLAEFGEAPAAEDSSNPFPPGYADDVSDA
jgi:predicted RNA-binding protein with PIN domain